MGENNSNGDEGGAEPHSVFTAMVKEFNNFREKEKAKLEDEEGTFSPFAGMEKSAVLQEAKAAFNSSNEVRQHPHKCSLLLTKLLYLLVSGNSFSDTDLTAVFFSVTKLFQSNNPTLRRLTYLFLKDFAELSLTFADSKENKDTQGQGSNVIIVISSLTKDVNNSDNKQYRANAIRVLSRILDSQMLAQIERYIKQSIVDKAGLVASSALLSSYHMAATIGDQQERTGKREVVKRWNNEILEAISSGSEMVQFHALCLLIEIKKQDKLALSRAVSNYTKNISSIKSPLGLCVLIRYSLQLLKEDLNSLSAQGAYEFLTQCLRHKNEMVVYEAAKAMCNLPNLTSSDLLPAISVLNLFLSSSKPTLKFAAVRTLSDLASKSSTANFNADLVLSKSQSELELLINDANRSTATLAVTTLLKIAKEQTIDKLIKQINSLIGEIGDEFKVVIVTAVHGLCIKYTNKSSVLLNFLSSLLREEGGFEFKRVVVDSILNLIQTLPELKEIALLHLCEFIEDCEFSVLSCKVLFYLGEIGPECKNNSKFIRYIYNRIILESAEIRAASVTALGKFAAKVPRLKASVMSLLENCVSDEDDEVRDRATFCLSLLKHPKNIEVSQRVLANVAHEFINPAMLLKQLQVLEGSAAFEKICNSGIISFEMLPAVDESELDMEETKVSEDAQFLPEATKGTSPEIDAKGIEEIVVLKCAEFADYGVLLKSSKVLALTESETEYVVTVIKHVFQKHIVLQFNIANTLSDQVLVDALVETEETEAPDQWEKCIVIPARVVKYGETKQCFVSYALPKDSDALFSGNFMTELRFKSCTEDQMEMIASKGKQNLPEEEYVLEDVPIKLSDFICKTNIGTNFKQLWSTIASDENEIVEKLEFSSSQYPSLKKCALAVTDELGLEPVEGTSPVLIGEGDDVKNHTVLLMGDLAFNGTKNRLAAKALFVLNETSKAVALKLTVKSADPSIAAILIQAL